MAKGLVNGQYLEDIADSIRAKNGSSNTYRPSQMASAIDDIPELNQTTVLQWSLNNKTDYTGLASGLTSLTQLPTFTQPQNVNNYSYLFYGCSSLNNLTGINLTGSLFDSTFNGCSSLTAASVTLKSGLSKYSLRNSFNRCSSLSSATIINSGSTAVNPTFEDTFYGCSSLSTVNFSGNIVIRNDNISPKGMFFNCSALTSLPTYTLDTSNSSGVHNFTDSFMNCSSLTTVSGSQVSSVKNVSLSRTFSWCTNLTTISGTMDTTFCVIAQRCFESCSKLTALPFSDGALGSCANFERLCYGCTALVDVPRLDMKNATTIFYALRNMFTNCRNLSNNSLNNILASIATAGVTSNKTLKYIGLSSTQASTCTGLSNWSAASAAGWTTGY